MPTSARKTLPNRRDSFVINFFHDNIEYTCGYSYFPGTEDLAEIFIWPQIATSDLHHFCASTSTVVSIALQYGTPLKDLRGGLPKLHNGKPCCVLGSALNAIAAAKE